MKGFSFTILIFCWMTFETSQAAEEKKSGGMARTLKAKNLGQIFNQSPKSKNDKHQKQVTKIAASTSNNSQHAQHSTYRNMQKDSYTNPTHINKSEASKLGGAISSASIYTNSIKINDYKGNNKAAECKRVDQNEINNKEYNPFSSPVGSPNNSIEKVNQKWKKGENIIKKKNKDDEFITRHKSEPSAGENVDKSEELNTEYNPFTTPVGSPNTSKKRGSEEVNQKKKKQGDNIVREKRISDKFISSHRHGAEEGKIVDEIDLNPFGTPRDSPMISEESSSDEEVNQGMNKGENHKNKNGKSEKSKSRYRSGSDKNENLSSSGKDEKNNPFDTPCASPTREESISKVVNKEKKKGENPRKINEKMEKFTTRYRSAVNENLNNSGKDDECNPFGTPSNSPIKEISSSKVVNEEKKTGEKPRKKNEKSEKSTTRCRSGSAENLNNIGKNDEFNPFGTPSTSPTRKMNINEEINEEDKKEMMSNPLAKALQIMKDLELVTKPEYEGMEKSSEFDEDITSKSSIIINKRIQKPNKKKIPTTSAESSDEEVDEDKKKEMMRDSLLTALNIFEDIDKMALDEEYEKSLEVDENVASKSSITIEESIQKQKKKKSFIQNAFHFKNLRKNRGKQ